MENTLEYKGYVTNICFDAEDHILHGKIEGIDDLVTFEGSSEDIENEFHSAVDDYLSYCEEIGKEPLKPCKGTLRVRISPELHQRLSTFALRNGLSMNQAVENAIRKYVSSKT